MKEDIIKLIVFESWFCCGFFGLGVGEVNRLFSILKCKTEYETSHLPCQMQILTVIPLRCIDLESVMRLLVCNGFSSFEFLFNEVYKMKKIK